MALALLSLVSGALGGLLSVVSLPFLARVWKVPSVWVAASDLVSTVVTGILLVTAACITLASHNNIGPCGILYLFYSAVLLSLCVTSITDLCLALSLQQSISKLRRDERRDGNSKESGDWLESVMNALSLVSWFAPMILFLLVYLNTDSKVPKLFPEKKLNYTLHSRSLAHDDLLQDLWNYNSRTSDWQADNKENLVIWLVKGVASGNLTHEQLAKLHADVHNYNQGHGDFKAVEDKKKEVVYSFLKSELNISEGKIDEILSHYSNDATSEAAAVPKSTPDTRYMNTDKAWITVVAEDGSKSNITVPSSSLLPHNSSILFQLINNGLVRNDDGPFAFTRPVETVTTFPSTVSADPETLFTPDPKNPTSDIKPQSETNSATSTPSTSNGETEITDIECTTEVGQSTESSFGQDEAKPAVTPNSTWDEESCFSKGRFFGNLHLVLILLAYAAPVLVSSSLYCHASLNLRPRTEPQRMHVLSSSRILLKRTLFRAIVVHCSYIILWLPFLLERVTQNYTNVALILTSRSQSLFLLAYWHCAIRIAFYLLESSQTRVRVGSESSTTVSVQSSPGPVESDC